MRLLWIMVIGMTMMFTLNAADLAGQWKGSVETQAGAMNVTITIQPGATLAGKIDAGEYGGKIENGKMEGDNISFETTIQAGTLSFEGTVAGAEMKLNMTGTQGTKYSLVCKRQK